MIELFTKDLPFQSMDGVSYGGTGTFLPTCPETMFATVGSYGQLRTMARVDGGHAVFYEAVTLRFGPDLCARLRMVGPEDRPTLLYGALLPLLDAATFAALLTKAEERGRLRGEELARAAVRKALGL